VPGEEAFGVDHVAAVDGVEQQPVLGVDDPLAARAGQREERAAVVGGRVPQPGDGGGQLVDPAAGVAAQVELAVELQEIGDGGARPLRNRLDPLLQLGQCPQVVEVELGDALADGELLELLAHPVDDVDLVHGQAGHPGALVPLVLGEPLGLEDPQRLAHRQPAGTQPLGDLLLPDPLARADLAAEDRAAQVVGDPGAGRPHRRPDLEVRHENRSGWWCHALPCG
jgi:hypothetical protein